MTRVLGGLEVKKKLIEKQQEEITSVKDKLFQSLQDRSELAESVQALSRHLHRSESERQEW